MSYEVVRLGDVADIVTGNTPSKSSDEFWINGIIPFVTPGELKYNSTNYVESASDNVTELALSTARVIPKNSVMVCCIGSLGKLGIASRDLITNQQINSVVFKEEVAHYKFGYYAISLLRNEMEKIAPSTTVKIINKTLFSNLQIPLPPLDIQKKIAHALDKAQELIDKRKEQISALDKFLENLFLDMFGDPVSNPMGWEVKSAEDLCEFITKGSTPESSLIYDEVLEEGVPFIKVYHIMNDGKLDINYKPSFIENNTHNKLMRSKVVNGDILMNIVGPPLGKIAIVDTEYLECNINQAIAFFRVKSLLNNKYLLHMLRSPNKTKQIISTAIGIRQLNLSLAQCRELEIPLPPLDLQNQFASIVEKVEAEKTKLEASLKKMEDNFNSIMQRAFKGELF